LFLQLCNGEQWPYVVTKAVSILFVLIPVHIFAFHKYKKSLLLPFFHCQLIFWMFVCLCDCKQIGKFLYSVIMSEVKVDNVSAKKCIKAENDDTADGTFVR